MYTEIVKKGRLIFLIIVLGLIVGVSSSGSLQKNTSKAQDRVPQACENIYGRVPSAVINTSLANPEGVPGWGDSVNPPKIWLSIKNFEKPYNTVANPLVFKATCPYPRPTPYDGPGGHVFASIAIRGTIPSDRFIQVKACDEDQSANELDCSKQTLVYNGNIQSTNFTEGSTVPIGKKVILVSPYIYDEHGNEIEPIAPEKIRVTECDGVLKYNGCFLEVENKFHFISFEITHSLEDDRQFGDLSGTLEIQDKTGDGLLDSDFKKTIEFCRGFDDICVDYKATNNFLTFRDKKDDTLVYDFNFQSNPFFGYNLILGKPYYLRVKASPPDTVSTYYYSPIEQVQASDTKIKLKLTLPKRVKSCKLIGGNGWHKLLIVPDGFTSLDEFLKYATMAADDLKEVLNDPIADAITFLAHEDISQDYNCTIRGDRILECDSPHDAKGDCGSTSSLTISKNDQFGGMAVYHEAYVTSSSIKIGTATHELGHSIADLADEYIEAGRNAYEAPNCTLIDTCPKWLPDDELGCFQGCTSESGYRPTETSIMRSLNDRFFNKPSLRAWTDELTQQAPLQKLLQNRAFSLHETYHRAIKIVLENKNGTVKLLSVALVDAYPQSYTSKTFGTDDYKISLRNRSNREIYSGNVPYKLRQLHLSDSGDTVIPDVLINPIVLFLPYSSSAHNVVISDEKGKQKLNIKVPASSKQDLNSKSLNLCGNGLCDGLIGENASSCRSDCSTPRLPVGLPR